MKKATSAEVEVALKSLLAHTKPPDEHLVDYERLIQVGLKKRIRYRANVEKTRWFKNAIKDAFDKHAVALRSKRSQVKGISEL